MVALLLIALAIACLVYGAKMLVKSPFKTMAVAAAVLVAGAYAINFLDAAIPDAPAHAHHARR